MADEELGASDLHEFVASLFALQERGYEVRFIGVPPHIYQVEVRKRAAEDKMLVAGAARSLVVREALGMFRRLMERTEAPA